MTTSRIALVTGGNRGIGLETCRQLLAHGLRVVMGGRDTNDLQRATDLIGGGSGNLLTVRLDVTDPASIQAAHREIQDRLGAVDVLVNNAAVLIQKSTKVLDIPDDTLRQTFDTNLFGAIAMCRVFVPPMVTRGYGRVVNVSSSVGQLSTMSTYAPAYSMSKTALNAFTKVLAATYRERGVLVNSVDPGWVRTRMGGTSAPRSVEEGADSIVWAATLPDKGPTGGFFRDRKPLDW